MQVAANPCWKRVLPIPHEERLGLRNSVARMGHEVAEGQRRRKLSRASGKMRVHLALDDLQRQVIASQVNGNWTVSSRAACKRRPHDLPSKMPSGLMPAMSIRPMK